MMICDEMTARLDKIWNRLQSLLQIPGISQIELDRECILWLDTAVTLEEEMMDEDKEKL